MITLFLSDTRRWLVEEEDAEVVGGVITHDHRLLTNRPSYRLLLLRLLPLCRQVLLLPPSHKLVQLGTKGGGGGGGGVK